MATAAQPTVKGRLKVGWGCYRIDANGVHYHLDAVGKSVPQEPYCPKGRWRRLPDDFLDALVVARRFMGAPNAEYPWLKFGYLSDGKIYATDNQVLVEVDVGDHTLPATLFRSGDIKVLSSQGTSPARMLVAKTLNAFSWDDGSWVQMHRFGSGLVPAKDGSGFRPHYPRTYTVRDQIKSLLTYQWREPTHSIADDQRSDLLAIIQKHKRNPVVGISSKQIRVQEAGDASMVTEIDFGFPTKTESYWPGSALKKALAVADKIDFSGKPACFTFPKGRGLIVASSNRVLNV